MAKFMCECGMFMKPVKSQGSRTKIISNKVLIVKTETHYKCPKGCAPKTVTEYK